MTYSSFEPTTIAFRCNCCSYGAAARAGTSRIKYPPNLRMIRVMCSGRVDPTFVLKAFALGADAVMIAGCHPGECHYLEQNYKTMRRFSMLRHTLRALGIEDGRLRLQWASAAEGAQLARAIGEMTEEVRALGPLNWPAQWSEEDGSIETAIQQLEQEHAQAMEVAA